MPFGVTETAQVAAVASLDAQEELDERVRAIIAERDRVVAALREQGWEFPTPYANYFWLPLGERTGQAAAAFRGRPHLRRRARGQRSGHQGLCGAQGSRTVIRHAEDAVPHAPVDAPVPGIHRRDTLNMQGATR